MGRRFDDEDVTGTTGRFATGGPSEKRVRGPVACPPGVMKRYPPVIWTFLRPLLVVIGAHTVPSSGRDFPQLIG
jgi:hypothetical protein